MHVPNDGSVSGAPCHCCSGTLVLRAVPNGGFMLGCSNFQTSVRCTFTMGPNTDEVNTLRVEQAKRRDEREARRAAKAELIAAKEAAKVAKIASEKDVFCVMCGESLPVMIRHSDKFCLSCGSKARVGQIQIDT